MAEIDELFYSSRFLATRQLSLGGDGTSQVRYGESIHLSAVGNGARARLLNRAPGVYGNPAEKWRTPLVSDASSIFVSVSYL